MKDYRRTPATTSVLSKAAESDHYSAFDVALFHSWGPDTAVGIKYSKQPDERNAPIFARAFDRHLDGRIVMAIERFPTFSASFQQTTLVVAATLVAVLIAQEGLDWEKSLLGSADGRTYCTFGPFVLLRGLTDIAIGLNAWSTAVCWLVFGGAAGVIDDTAIVQRDGAVTLL